MSEQDREWLEHISRLFRAYHEAHQQAVLRAFEAGRDLDTEEWQRRREQMVSAVHESVVLALRGDATPAVALRAAACQEGKKES